MMSLDFIGIGNLFIETDRIGRTPFRKGNPLFQGNL